MYKMGSRMTALAGVHLGERVGVGVGVGTGVVCGIRMSTNVHKREACVSSTFFSISVAMNVTACDVHAPS